MTGVRTHWGWGCLVVSHVVVLQNLERCLLLLLV